MFSKQFLGAVLAVVVVLAALPAPALAQSDATGTEAYSDFQALVDGFNERVDGVDLGPAGDRLAGQTTNVLVETPEGPVALSFAMDENNHITDVRPSHREDADLRMTTDAETVETIAGASDKAAAFRDAYTGGDISIQPNYGVVDALMTGRVVDYLFWTFADLFKGFL